MDWVKPSSLGESTRIFYESEDFPRPKRSSIEKLSGACVTEESAPRRLFRGTGGYRYGVWELQFTYEGFQFLVESNSHAGLGYFWVDDPSCPNATLLKVLDHFLGPPPVPTVAGQLINFEQEDFNGYGCALLISVSLFLAICLLIYVMLS